MSREKWNENVESCSDCGIKWKKIGKSCPVCYAPPEKTAHYTSVEDMSNLISGSEHDLNDDEIDTLLGASQ